jgi:ParB-like chromosome segregation protein Spo0J
VNFQFRSEYQFIPPLNDTDRANLKRSIEEQGILQPVVVDEEGYVLDGHNRVEIARELGVLDSQIPTVMKVGMDESQKSWWPSRC